MRLVATGKSLCNGIDRRIHGSGCTWRCCLSSKGRPCRLLRRGWSWPSGIVGIGQDRGAWLRICIVRVIEFAEFATRCGEIPRRGPQGA